MAVLASLSSWVSFSSSYVFCTITLLALFVLLLVVSRKRLLHAASLMLFLELYNLSKLSVVYGVSLSFLITIRTGLLSLTVNL